MTCPADHELSLHADGELTTNRAREVDAHLATCASCRARQQHLRALAGGIGAAYPAPVAEPAFTRDVVGRLAATKPARAPRPRLALVGAAVALAGALVFFQTTTVDPGTFGARGAAEPPLAGPPSARNVGFAAHAEGGRRLAAGDVVAPTAGFTFRVFNHSGRAVSMMLLALDAQGEVHWFYPAFLDPATNPVSRLIGADQVALDLEEGVTPDRPAPGRMTLIGLFAAEPLDVHTVEAELRAGGLAALTAPVVHTLALEVSR